MALNKCSDFYYKAINFDDKKNLIILKSEDVTCLEEAYDVLVNHYQNKSNLIDFKVNKTDADTKYEMDFLLQFQNKQYQIESHLINLLRFLRIRRDDYLMRNELINFSNDNDSGSNRSKDSNRSRDSNREKMNGTLNEDLIVLEDDESRRSFAYNLNAKKFVPSNDAEILNSTQNDIVIDEIDNIDGIGRKFESSILMIDEIIGRKDLDEIVLNEERPRRRRDDDVQENNVKDEERPRRRRESVQDENEKSLNESQKMSSNNSTFDEDRSRRRDFNRSPITIEDITDQLSKLHTDDKFKTKVDQVNKVEKLIQKYENKNDEERPRRRRENVQDENVKDEERPIRRRETVHDENVNDEERLKRNEIVQDENVKDEERPRRRETVHDENFNEIDKSNSNESSIEDKSSRKEIVSIENEVKKNDIIPRKSVGINQIGINFDVRFKM